MVAKTLMLSGSKTEDVKVWCLDKRWWAVGGGFGKERRATLCPEKKWSKVFMKYQSSKWGGRVAFQLRYSVQW
jgi:hypothetical protein